MGLVGVMKMTAKEGVSQWGMVWKKRVNFVPNKTFLNVHIIQGLVIYYREGAGHEKKLNKKEVIKI